MTTQPQVIIRQQTGTYELFVTLDDQAVECRLTIRPKGAVVNLTPDALAGSLKEKGIAFGVDNEALAAACQTAASGHPVEALLIAWGQPPKPGTNGHLEFKIKPSSGHPEYKPDAKGQVDFHVTHLFENAVAGQLIAILHPTLQGEPGMSVQNRKIPVPPLVPFTVKAGQGVECRNETEFIATEPGRVIFAKNTISVTDVFLVEGNVNYAVGHIDFQGMVHVTGDVLDGFNVKAGKDLQVDKAIGICRIEVKGNVTIGGMNGLGIAHNSELHRHSVIPLIKCGGNLTAKYLHNVTIECDGDIHVTNEVLHCTLRCGGNLVVDKLIAGGDCIALGGIEAGKVGTAIGVKTLLCAGEDFRIVSKGNELRTTWHETTKQRDHLANICRPYAHRNIHSLLPDMVAELTTMLQKIQELEKRIAELDVEIKALPSPDAPQGNPKINVRIQLCQDTIIHLGNTINIIKDAHSCPCSIIEWDEPPLLFLPLTPLSKPRHELEEEILRKSEITIRRMADTLKVLHQERMTLTEVVFAIQNTTSHTACYGLIPKTCGEPKCPFRTSCLKEHKKSHTPPPPAPSP